MSLTLEAIAKQAGVSRSTVSRVVHNRPHVDPDTRARVLAVAQALDTHAAMKAEFTPTLGLVIPRRVLTLFTDPYFSLLVQGISSACKANNYALMLWLADPDYERRTIHHLIEGAHLDGVIVASNQVNDPVVQVLLEYGVPFILIGRDLIHPRVSYIDIDNQNSAREMVAHLLRLGRRRVATIAGPQNMIAGADRLQGYLSALRDRGVIPDPDLIVEADFTEAGGDAAMGRLLPYKPDAVFVASDVMVVGALRAIREVGLRVPQDIAVAGFDDMPIAVLMDPPLTTVHQPITHAGTVAVETLLDLVKHPHSPAKRIILPTEIIIRSSCGADLAH